jgi:hypothetical protein
MLNLFKQDCITSTYREHFFESLSLDGSNMNSTIGNLFKSTLFSLLVFENERSASI